MVGSPACLPGRPLWPGVRVRVREGLDPSLPRKGAAVGSLPASPLPSRNGTALSAHHPRAAKLKGDSQSSLCHGPQNSRAQGSDTTATHPRAQADEDQSSPSWIYICLQSTSSFWLCQIGLPALELDQALLMPEEAGQILCPPTSLCSSHSPAF